MYLSIYLSIYLFIYISTFISIYISIYPCIYLNLPSPSPSISMIFLPLLPTLFLCLTPHSFCPFPVSSFSNQIFPSSFSLLSSQTDVPRFSFLFKSITSSFTSSSLFLFQLLVLLTSFLFLALYFVSSTRLFTEKTSPEDLMCFLCRYIQI